ncbi:DUF580-domain-containing protein [Peniophora sp. CONT]|nr:DUF580-domain-containing protein [Peniophora sp. CONT]
MDSDTQPLVYAGSHRPTGSAYSLPPEYSLQENYHNQRADHYADPYDPPIETPLHDDPFADKHALRSGPYPGPSQPYAETYYPPGAPSGFGPNGPSPFAGERFKPKNGIRDPFFLILFLVQLAAFIGVSAYSVYSWFRDGGRFEEDDVTEDIGFIAKKYVLQGESMHERLLTLGPLLIAIVIGAALLLSTAYFILLRLFTTFMMHLSLILTALLNGALCAYFVIQKVWSNAIVFGVVTLFSVFIYWGMRSRIPLASLLLRTVMDITKEHMSVYIVALLTMLVQASLSVWLIFAIVASLETWSESRCSSSANSCNQTMGYGFVIFMGVSYIYTSIIVGNIAVATLAGGPFGCWYYFGPRTSSQMPRWPAASAFGRAATSSLGSIAFGSMIVTILEIIKGLLHSASNDTNDIRSHRPYTGGLSILACCAECCVGFIENLVEAFNRYAYVEIALYGKSYIKAAKDTWRLIKNRGVDAIINDSLVNNVLAWGALCNGLLCMLFAYLWVHLGQHESFDDHGGELIAAMVFAFVVGVRLQQTLATVFEAGVSTIFVGLAEDPGVLAIRSPVLFGMIADRYPKVVEGIPGSVRV